MFCVARVSKDVTPRVTRAGVAAGLIQNDTHDLYLGDSNEITNFKPKFQIT